MAKPHARTVAFAALGCPLEVGGPAGGSDGDERLVELPVGDGVAADLADARVVPFELGPDLRPRHQLSHSSVGSRPTPPWYHRA